MRRQMPHKNIGRPPTAKQHGAQHRGHPVIVVQPDIEAVLGQIGRVLGHSAGVVMLGFAQQNPAHVRPPAAIARGVRIAGLIRFLVMHAMRRHPENRSALQRQRAADRKEIFQPQRHLVRPVRVQPVVAHADAETDRDLVKHGRYGKSAPTEHEEGGDRPHMQEYQERSGERVKPLASCQLGDVFSFHCFPS